MDIKEININEQDLISIDESDLNTFQTTSFLFLFNQAILITIIMDLIYILMKKKY